LSEPEFVLGTCPDEVGVVFRLGGGGITRKMCRLFWFRPVAVLGAVPAVVGDVAEVVGRAPVFNEPELVLGTSTDAVGEVFMLGGGGITRKMCRLFWFTPESVLGPAPEVVGAVPEVSGRPPELSLGGSGSLWIPPVAFGATTKVEGLIPEVAGRGVGLEFTVGGSGSLWIPPVAFGATTNVEGAIPDVVGAAAELSGESEVIGVLTAVGRFAEVVGCKPLAAAGALAGAGPLFGPAKASDVGPDAVAAGAALSGCALSCACLATAGARPIADANNTELNNAVYRM
jgi:hypothetical protein